jgi:hypothetical protein
MYYICIEDDRVISVLDYAPNVPDTVIVKEIDSLDFERLTSRTHYFDIPTMSVMTYSTEVLDRRSQAELNKEYEKLLSSTDWKVMRHIREKALGMPTSLSDAEYVELEQQRQTASESIIR